MKSNIQQLVGGAELLRLIWSDASRPSADWLRIQSREYLKDKTKGIPCHKPTGAKNSYFFYDVDEVRKRLGLNGGGK
jgi:hypothetical protein